jgi:hypothetical protein
VSDTSDGPELPDIIIEAYGTVTPPPGYEEPADCEEEQP